MLFSDVLLPLSLFSLTLSYPYLSNFQSKFNVHEENTRIKRGSCSAPILGRTLPSCGYGSTQPFRWPRLSFFYPRPRSFLYPRPLSFLPLLTSSFIRGSFTVCQILCKLWSIKSHWKDRVVSQSAAWLLSTRSPVVI